MERTTIAEVTIQAPNLQAARNEAALTFNAFFAGSAYEIFEERAVPHIYTDRSGRPAMWEVEFAAVGLETDA